MSNGLMVDKNNRIKNLNSQMFRLVRDAIKTGHFTTDRTGMSPTLMDRISRLDNEQIDLIATKLELNGWTPKAPIDKEASVYWEDLIYFCEQDNETELEELLDRLFKKKDAL